jgi:hypothetical protein
VQSSGRSDSTCLVRVERKVRRYRSCCSEGRACSFLRSSSGVSEGSVERGGGGVEVEPFGGEADIGTSGEGITRRVRC